MSRILPPLFCENVRSLLPDSAEKLLDTLATTDPDVSVRANRLKGASAPADADLVPWSRDGFYLPERPIFAADPAWHQGLYYVQDASSMAIAEVVRHLLENELSGREAIRCLDACAAPGGKTGAVLELLPADSLMIANEYDSRRANILAENLCKLGAPNVAISRGPAQKYGSVGEVFDLVLVDAPCSGEGMMRKEAEAIAQWQPGLVRQCSSLQREILSELWEALKPGGVLVYSTCTFNRDEDEDNLAYLVDELGAEAIELPLARYEGIRPGIGILPAYRFLPGYVRGEGLFVCAVRKADGTASVRKQKGSPKAKADAAWKAFADKVLAEPANFIVDGTDALPVAHADFLVSLKGQIDFIRLGLPLGTEKGRDIAPSHELAMSTALKNNHFPTLELAYPEAFSYLRGEGLSDIPANIPRGYFLTTYLGKPLGLAKNIGNRANNLYPDFLRLRLPVSAMPTTAPEPIVQLQ